MVSRSNDPAAKKTRCSFHLAKCAVCQINTKEKLSTAGDKGMATLMSVRASLQADVLISLHDCKVSFFTTDLAMILINVRQDCHTKHPYLVMTDANKNQ